MNPNLSMSIIMDAQAGLDMPHIVPPSKAHAGKKRVQLKIYGVINHGYPLREIYTYWQEVENKGADRTISLLVIHLYHVFSSSPRRPPTLQLQMDNCSGENKNQYVLAALCWLVHLKIFSEIFVNFLPTGHTHEDIDQMFSITAHVKQKSCILIEDAVPALRAAFKTGEPSSFHDFLGI